jgi:dTDP-4-amino-4,6-dideoxygalactose transaminase
MYRERLTGANGVRLQAGFGETWVSSVCLLECDGPDAARLEDALEGSQIGTRRWWGQGAHAHPSTVQLPRTELPITERLAASTIGVPLYRDMQREDVERVATCVRAYAGRR